MQESGSALSVFESVLSVSIGVDIGQKHDPTAIAVAEVRERPAPLPLAHETLYRIQRMERLDLGVDYVRVARYLVALLLGLNEWEKQLRKDEFEARLGRWDRRNVRLPVDLYVDATGVGTPVVDMLAEALRQQPASERARLHPIWFNHGDRFDSGGGILGKAYLVSRLQVLFQGNLVQIHPASPEVDQMVRELKDYEIKIDENGTDRYGAFRMGTHDDLATALGLACLEDPLLGRVEVGPVIW